MEHTWAVFLDLDGTLLNTKKELTKEAEDALYRADAAGAWIVPATGRFYGAIPEAVRRLPFVRYYISINGAEVYDAWEKRALHRAEIPMARALEIFDILDGYPGVYDCYAQGQGYMDSAAYARIPALIGDETKVKFLQSLRVPVENFKREMAARFPSIQKTQLLFGDMQARAACLKELPERLPDYCVTTSLDVNVEVSSREADKGRALAVLRDYLGIAPGRTVAFGDNSNDAYMLREAGIGVAMGNSTPEALAVADMVTDTNDRDGVAKALKKIFGF